MVEWSITTDCKSVGFGLRRFESSPAHTTKNPKHLGFFHNILAEILFIYNTEKGRRIRLISLMIFSWVLVGLFFVYLSSRKTPKSWEEEVKEEKQLPIPEKDLAVIKEPIEQKL